MITVVFRLRRDFVERKIVDQLRIIKINIQSLNKWCFDRLCWLSQSEVWYNNSKDVQKLAPFCISCHVVLSFLHGLLLNEQLILMNSWCFVSISSLDLSHLTSSIPGLQEFPLVSLPYSDRYKYNNYISVSQSDLRDAESAYPSQNMKTAFNSLQCIFYSLMFSRAGERIVLNAYHIIVWY